MQKLALGIYDSPQTQQQPVFYVDLTKSNMVVFGGAMTGKTTLIKTLLVRLHENHTPQEENVYIIDFGGNIGAYGDLSHVCARFDNSNEENIKRIFKTIEKRMAENGEKLKNQVYSNFTGEDRPTHVTLIIENVNAFLAEGRYASYHEKLQMICRDGLSKGVSVVLTANDTAGGLSRYLSNFGQKIAFEMPPEKYFDIFNEKVDQPMKLPGRGIATVSGAPFEFQCFLPFAEEARELGGFMEEMNRRAQSSGMPEKMIAFGKELTKENFQAYNADHEPYEVCDACDDSIVVGLDYYEHRPVSIQFRQSPAIAIYGKRQFGKTNLLTILVTALIKKHPNFRLVFFDDGRKQLLQLHNRFAKGENNVYLSKYEALDAYLFEHGYFKLPGKSTPFAEQENPFTVFIMQSKAVFQSNAKNLSMIAFPQMTAKAEEKGYLFLFSDMRRFSDAEVRNTFENNLSAAFLLDNIGEFAAEKGSKSVFGEMDPKELKEEYAKCEKGDGYYYDIESDEVKKVKFIHVMGGRP